MQFWTFGDESLFLGKQTGISTLQETEKAATPYGETARYMICHTPRGGSMAKTLFALHKLVGLRHAVIEISTAIHVDTRLNGLIQALHERADGLQEREVCIGLGNAHIVRRRCA